MLEALYWLAVAAAFVVVCIFILGGIILVWSLLNYQYLPEEEWREHGEGD